MLMEKSKMKVADWRKLYKFKYCNGSIIITEYLGNEECIEIPEMIGTKYVTGIAKRAFKSINMSEKNVNVAMKDLKFICHNNNWQYCVI